MQIAYLHRLMNQRGRKSTKIQKPLTTIMGWFAAAGNSALAPLQRRHPRPKSPIVLLNSRGMLRLLLMVLIGVPLTVLFYKRLSPLPQSARLFAVVCCVVILVAGIVLLYDYWKQVGRTAKWLTIGAVLSTTVFFWQSGSIFPEPSEATIGYSDGSTLLSQSPDTKGLWGRAHHMWTLHPPYASVRTADKLEAPFLDTPSRVKIWVSKPPAVLLLPDGTPTNSDGISLEIDAIDRWGKIAKTKRVTISQPDFLEHRWISISISVAARISRVTVTHLCHLTGRFPRKLPDFRRLRRVGARRVNGLAAAGSV